MAQYKSFDTSKNKIFTTWNQADENESKINNELELLNLNFRSHSIFKNIEQQTLLTDYITSPSTREYQWTWRFAYMPDWVQGSSFLHTQFSLDTAYDISTNNTVNPLTFSQANSQGLLEGNNIQISSLNNVNYWWTKKDENVWELTLNIFIDIQIVFPENLGGGFTATRLPTFINTTLYRVNQRNYYAVQSAKK